MHCSTIFRGIVLGTMQHPSFFRSYFGSERCNCTPSARLVVPKFCSSENKQKTGVLFQVCSALPSIGSRTLGRVMSPIYFEKTSASLFQRVNVLLPIKGGVG
mmetsp:Transcript_7608/g.46918  ORF Transcript_7608/g.46918 Transcript_7608/m.46918 type:complete len:102 (+) Transcript_7608:2009-2314(+)